MTLALTSHETCAPAPSRCTHRAARPATHSPTKSQVVEAILELNATATRDWLMGFDFHDLRGYWMRLQHAGAPRGNGWDARRAS